MARKLVVEIVGDPSSLNRALISATQSASVFQRNAGRMGSALKTAAAAGTVALGALAVSSIKTAANYETALNTFQAVSHATAGQMKQVGQLAKQLGNDLTLPATSAKDAADAMTELAKGGLSVRDTMAAAKGVLQLSAAAQISNADAATITARALNSFKLAGDQAVHVADVLANAANKSTGEVTDFALALQQSSAVASQTGLSIEDTTAALMQLAQAGIVGSDAGTSLKTMLQFLTPKSKQAAEAMKRLGVDVYDSHGKFVGIRDTIRQFHDALVRLTPEQRKSALQTIFGSDAIRAANIVLGEGVGAFDRYRKAADQHGSAADLAAAKTRGMNGALEAFKSAVETLQITVGQLALGPMTDLVRKLSDGAQFANSFITELQHLDGAAATATRSQVTAATSVAHTGATMDAGTRAAIEHAETMRKLAAVARGLETGLIQVASALFTMTAKIVGGIDAVVRFNDRLGEMTRNGLRSVGAFASGVPGAITGAIGDAAAASRRLVAAITGKIDDAVAAIKTLPTKARDALGNLGGVLADAGRQLIGGFIGGLESMYDRVKSSLVGLKDKLTSWKGPPSVDAVLLHPAGRLVIGGFIAGLESRYKEAENSLKGFGSSLAISESIRAAARSIGLAQAEQVAAGFVQGTPTVAQRIREGLAQAIQQARQAVVDARGALRSDFQSLATSVLQGFDDKVAAWTPPALKLLNQMQAEDQLNQLKRELASAQQQVADAQAAVAVAVEPGDVKDAQQKLLEAQQSYADASRQITEYNLQLTAAKQQEAHDLEAAKQRERLAQSLLTLQTELGKHPEEWAKVSRKTIALLDKFNVPLFESGQKFGSMFADGIRSQIPTVEKAAEALAAAVAKYVPHSPAEKGPLSQLPGWADYFTSGLPSALTMTGSELQGIPGTGGQFLATSGGFAAAPAFAPVVNVTVHGVVGNGSDVARVIRNELVRMHKRGNVGISPRR